MADSSGKPREPQDKIIVTSHITRMLLGAWPRLISAMEGPMEALETTVI